MAKELVLDVVARKNSKDLLLLAQEFETLAHEIDGANKSAQQNVTFSKFLDDQISETKKQVQQLAQEFDKTGNADLFARLRGAQTNLTNLTRLRNQVVNFSEAEKEATKELEGSDKVLRGLSDSYNNLGSDVRKVENDYKDLTDRIKTQTETIRNLQKESRGGGDVPFDISYYRQASKSLDDLREQAIDLRTVLKAAPEDASKSFKTFGDFVSNQIQGQRSLVKSLRDDLTKTGNFSVFGDLKKAEAGLRDLEAIGKDIGVAVKDGLQDAAQEGEKSLGSMLQALPGQAQAAIVPTIVGGLVLAAPAIGAAINGILLAGVGGGAIAAGIIGQLKTPQVAAAFGELKTTASQVLTASTAAFAPVLLGAAHSFQDDLLKAEPKLQAAFDRLAPHAQAIFTGLEGLASKAAPGLFEALDAAGPILDQIGQDLPELGRAFSTFFHSIADGAGGAKDGIHDLFVVTEATIKGVGYLVEGLSKSFTILEAFGKLARGDAGGAGQKLSDLATNSHAAADAAKDIVGAFHATTDAASKASAALAQMNNEIDRLIGDQLSVDGANDAFQKGLNDLAQSLDKNNHSLVGSSDAAIQNRDAIRALIAQAQQARDAQIQMAGGANASKQAVDQANATYDAAIKKIEDVGVKAGLSKDQLNALAGEYDIKVIATVQAASVGGAVGDVLSKLLGGRASGGPVTAGQPYVVGEEGPELMVPGVSGQIIPNDKLASLQAASVPPPNFRASSAAGGGTFILQAAPGGDSLTAQYIHALVDHGVLQLVRA